MFAREDFQSPMLQGQSLRMGALIQAACLHAKARQKEEALAMLERVFGRGWWKRDWVEHEAPV